MIDFEQELYNRFGQVKDFTLGMRIAKYFYELGRGHSEIPNNHEGLEEYASRAGFNYVDDIVLLAEPNHRWNGHDVEFAYRDGMIAGAEWAFGQGVTVDGCITKIGNDCYLDIDGDQEQRLSVFDNEEEVIVQIRKKRLI